MNANNRTESLPTTQPASLARIWRHITMTSWHARRAFSHETLDAIEQAISQSEGAHGGEIRFVVERELTTAALLRNVTPRARALQVFGEYGVWNTANNNGVLIYVSLADRDVEIVADRGFNGLVTDEEWASVCHTIEKAYSEGDFKGGSVAGIAAVNKLFMRHFPGGDANELPNRPLIL